MGFIYFLILFYLLLKLFSLTWTISTSPNLAKARARRASNRIRVRIRLVVNLSYE